MSRLSDQLDRIYVRVGRPEWTIARKIRRHAKVFEPIAIRLEYRAGLSDAYACDAIIVRRERNAIAVAFDFRRLHLDGGALFGIYAARPALFVHLLRYADPAVEAFVGTIDDDVYGRLAGFSANEPDPILVPDPDFFNSRGYAAVRSLAANPVPWKSRSETIAWRGSTSGTHPGSAPPAVLRVTLDDMSPGNPALIQRVRMCLLMKEVAGTDAAFSNVVQTSDPGDDRRRLVEAGILRGELPLAEWRNRRFAIDVDGNANAWSNLFCRLLLGCCVIKIGSERGFRQWYYDDLVPWRHYVPVAADMSDLSEKIDWCRSHPDACETIADEGRTLAMSMTFEREMARGVDAINRAFGEGGSVPYSAA